jgi:hypothetical protein
MNISRFLLLVFIAITASACVNNTTQRHVPEYRSILGQNRNILILPPEVVVYSVESSGSKKRMYDYEYNLESIIIDQMIPTLQNKGFSARLLSRKEIHEQNLHEEVARLNGIYGTNRDELYVKALWEEKDAFAINKNVGQAAATIGSKNNSNLLLLTDYARSIKTSGLKTLNVMTDLFLGTRTSAEGDVAVVVVGIIEAKTGRIIWANHEKDIRSSFSSSSDKKVETAQIKYITSNIFKPLDQDKK